ncbi:MAG TPA: YceI family protein [Vicinamibacteria bacterium]|nr:YceI family protein [Vicinamibacteria bacterium]
MPSLPSRLGRGPSWTRGSWALVAPALLTLALAAPRSHAADAAWKVVSGEVRVVCPMTVGGSFEAKTGAIRGTVTLAPSAAVFGGEIAVDLGTLDTGIGLRDEHLQKTYLQVSRGAGYDHAVLSEIRLGDGGDPRSVQGKTRFAGTFLLHGTKATIGGPATVRQEGKTVRVEASFPVSVSAFGIEKPQYLGVGVKDQVNVSVSLVAQPSEGPETKP